jgi:DNA repair protein RecN (Recombination protein N)
MLSELRVKNFSLVEDASVDIGRGFTVFTGETGAGKSLLLDAITLLLGAKASSQTVRNGASSAEVEGVFVLENEPKRIEKLREAGFEIEKDDGYRLLVRREISAFENSKNRIWIQGKNATRSQLQTFLGDWVEVSGQHEFLRLNQEGYILKIVDQFGNLRDQVKEFRQIYDRYLKVVAQYESLVADEKHKTARLDYLDFQIQELRKAGVSDDLLSREPQLEQNRNRLVSSEKIRKFVSVARDLLNGSSQNHFERSGDNPSILALLNSLQREILALSFKDEEIQNFQTITESIQDSVLLAVDSLESLAQKIEENPDELESLENQISNLNRLKRKHNFDSAGLVQFLADCELEARNLSRSSELIQQTRDEKITIQKELNARAADLSRSRVAVAAKLSQKWQESVRDLGLEKASLKIRITPLENLNSTGLDLAEALFTANTGESLKPLVKVASGGELSRLLLSLKSILANKSEIGVFLFDEIDTGIGGQAALQVATKLKDLAIHNQVLVVSHLASIASAANQHFRIFKSIGRDKTRTEINELDADGRLQEIARMLGGTDTKAAKTLAKELLQVHTKKKPSQRAEAWV